MDGELDGLDPYHLFDTESTRLDRFYSTVSGEGWSAPTRCAEWSVRDMLTHLLVSESYHHACLDGRPADWEREMVDKGATDVGALNAIGIDELADRTPTRLLADWRAASAITRRRFRERDDGEVATQEHANPALRIGHPVEIERIDRL
jgi:uncharacterized protein (TIGR03083 family)